MNCLNLISLSRASFRIFIEVPFLNFYLEILMFSSNITFMCLTYWCMHLYLNNLVHQSYTTGNDHSMIYSKVPNISPGLIVIRKHIFGGLYQGGLYQGAAYIRRAFCVAIFLSRLVKCIIVSMKYRFFGKNYRSSSKCHFHFSNYQRGGNLKKGEANFERRGSDPRGNYGVIVDITVAAQNANYTYSYFVHV